jgi:hypothetical protein
MENVDKNLKMPLHRQEREGQPSGQNAHVKGKIVWGFEQIIPLELLLTETRRVEKKLEEQKRQAGYLHAVNDLTGPNADEVNFGHVLEHAIIAAIDSKLPPNQLSTGTTRKQGINTEKYHLPEYNPKLHGKKIPHWEEIEISLAPAIPLGRQQHLVDQVLQQIEHQVRESGRLDLEKIELQI